MAKRIWILFLLLAAGFVAPAQQKSFYKRVPYFLSLNPSKLSYRLTHDLKTDSEKICAIHAWMTHKIRYDVKKWLKFDYSYQSPKKILRKRKTTCVGYSELFDVLCKYAGISSVTVPGYVKDINVDITDNYYEDEHTWNAVYFNNQWRLVDVCWDAGYVEYTKRTFGGFFVNLFSGGKADRVKFKIHFVNHPTDRYFFKSPRFFKTDHLPLLPMWQLMSPNFTIAGFKADSGYYYDIYDSTDIKTDTPDQYESQRQAYLAADSNERMSTDGISGYQFNYRNHWEIGRYYSLVTKIKTYNINKKSRDTIQQLKVCDTVIKYAGIAIGHLDSNDLYLQKQKSELKSSNERKRDTMASQNKRLIGATKGILSHFLTAKSRSHGNIKIATRLVNNNKRRLRKALTNSSYYLKRQARIYSPIDSLYYDSITQLIGGAIKKQKQRLAGLLFFIDSVYTIDSNNTAIYAKVLPSIINIENIVIENRTNYYDDLDYEVRCPKDTLIRYKLANDSLLYSGNKFRIIELLNEFRDLKKQVDVLVSLYKLKNQALKEYKGACVTSTLTDKEYQANLDDWSGEVDLLKSLKDRWVKRFKILRTYCAKNKEMSRIELSGIFLGHGGYYGERKWEFYFYPRRNNYINKHLNALIRANQRLDEKLTITKNRALSYKERLTKR